jgi:hypothetical protein
VQREERPRDREGIVAVWSDGRKGKTTTKYCGPLLFYSLLAFLKLFFLFE